MKKNDYWINFWKDYSKKAISKDVQSQVLRTVNKVPIEESAWNKILQFVLSHLNFNKEDDVLDLFGGNGLFAEEMAQRCKRVTVVDVSKELLDNIDTTKYKNITRIAKDVRKLSIPKNSYSKALIYAGIQYLSKKEVVSLYNFIFDSLKKDGICYIGDIPDENRRWNFFNNKKQEDIYFDSIIKN